MRAARIDDAQDQAGQGVFFWFVFFHVKENEQMKYIFSKLHKELYFLVETA